MKRHSRTMMRYRHQLPGPVLVRVALPAVPSSIAPNPKTNTKVRGVHRLNAIALSYNLQHQRIVMDVQDAPVQFALLKHGPDHYVKETCRLNKHLTVLRRGAAKPISLGPWFACQWQAQDCSHRYLLSYQTVIVLRDQVLGVSRSETYTAPSVTWQWQPWGYPTLQNETRKIRASIL